MSQVSASERPMSRVPVNNLMERKT
jgi:hypothetical protein